jgi:hypothetical protein
VHVIWRAFTALEASVLDLVFVLGILALVAVVALVAKGVERL